MQEYPPSTKFFLNSWTWGYEVRLSLAHSCSQCSHISSRTCLKVSRRPSIPTFVSSLSLSSRAEITSTLLQIHLDWYKHRMYTSSAVAASDPHLSQLGTLSEHSRFHACERRWKCDHVWGEGEGCYAFDADDYELLMGPKKFKKAGTGDGEGNVVFVNPWEMPQWRWEEHRQELEETFAQARDAREVFVEGRGRKRKAGAGVELPNALVRLGACIRVVSSLLTLTPHADHPPRTPLLSPRATPVRLDIQAQDSLSPHYRGRLATSLPRLSLPLSPLRRLSRSWRRGATSEGSQRVHARPRQLARQTSDRALRLVDDEHRKGGRAVRRGREDASRSLQRQRRRRSGGRRLRTEMDEDGRTCSGCFAWEEDEDRAAGQRTVTFAAIGVEHSDARRYAAARGFVVVGGFGERLAAAGVPGSEGDRQ